MCRLKISDLSFCQQTTEESEVKGGLNLALSIAEPNLNLLFTRLFPNTLEPSLEQYTHKEVYSDSGYAVSKLDSEPTGESGYLISSLDGKSQTLVLTSPNFASTKSLIQVTAS
ncbi:hypothetical protein RIVM261_055620 [Rivularia sp. IAM M-261]|nr:hypothetical protein CAL7716_009380 [Calothrix sp. PCC 7716]GJD20606.1 hypothetical protein RIVM261_055620 [Rivularia sp. IAM M-261]